MTTPSMNSSAKHEDALDILGGLNKKADMLRAGDEKTRDEMVTDCFRLISKLETPSETFMRSMWSHSMHPSILKVASDMGLFKALGESGTPKTVDQLAAATGSDRNLTRMICQNLAAMHFITETDIRTFAPTTLSNHLAEQMWISALGLFVPFSIITTARAPEFLKELKYQMPASVLDTPVQYSYGGRGELHMQAIMVRDGQIQGLASLMKLWLDNRPHWSDEKAGFYPLRKRLIEGANDSADAVFLVDIGGNQGHDFTRLFVHVDPAEIPGRLCLQDQPHVVKSIASGSLPSKVEATAHDFFTPQPIQGARVYFMHNIIHNFPDAEARTILKQTAAAMKKGYSKLLIWDIVLPDKGAGVNECCLDYLMMNFYGSSERTEAQWRKLLEDPEIGLRVVDVVRYSHYDQDVIELELA